MPASRAATSARARLGLGVLAAVILAVCALGPSGLVAPAAAGGQALRGRLWTATYVSGVARVTAPAPTARFAAVTVTGSGGVNGFGAACRVPRKGVIRISRLVATEIAGPPGAQAQEGAFFKALGRAATYRLSGGTLELRGRRGGLLVRFAAQAPADLTGRQWSAVGLTDGLGGLVPLVAQSRVTAEFAADGRLGGNAGVNLYGTRYTLGEAGAIAIDPRIVATAMAGPPDVMAQEQAYLEALPRAATYTIEGGELWLRDAAGTPLARFAAAPALPSVGAGRGR